MAKGAWASMKRILLLSILSLFLLSGCNQSNQNSASQSFKENDLDFTKTLEEEIKNVNLTGNGGDLIKAAYYTLNDDISFTILQVTLSTGQTVSVKFDGKIASYDLSSGYLTNENRQCVVFQTHAPSNYGSTNVHVLSVENDSSTGSPYLKEVLTLLDGYSDVDTPLDACLFVNSVYRIPNPQYNESANSVKYLSAFTSGGGIVDVQGRALQGLKVNIISSNKTIYAIIKFENSKWTSTIYEG